MEQRESRNTIEINSPYKIKLGNKIIIIFQPIILISHQIIHSYMIIKLM